MATQYPIPSGIDPLHLANLCITQIGRSPFGDGVSLFVTFDPDLTPTELTIFNTIVGVLNASSNFKNLPNWASYTPQQASDVITTTVLPGITTRADIDSFIAGLPNTIAGMKTGLTQVAYSVLAIRDILVALAKAIVYIRNILLNQ